jgi:F-type H+-transporting ATPase subunit b
VTSQTRVQGGHATAPRGRARRTRRGLLALLACLGAAGEAAAAEGGIQLFPGWLALVLLAVFIPLIPLLNALLFRPIFAVLDAREEKIEGTRQRAARISAEAEQILARYERSVREVREDAEQERKRRTQEARQEAARASEAARAEAEGEIERARRAVSAELTRARAELRAQASEIARAAAERVLGRSLS